MEAIPNALISQQSLVFSFNHHRPSFSRPISSLPFRIPIQSSLSSSSLKSFSSSSSLSIKEALSTSSSSSSSSLPPFSNLENLKRHFFQTLNSLPFSIFRTTFVAAVTATAFFYARFNLRPAIAALISPLPTVETTKEDDQVTENDSWNEIALEKHLNSHPDDVEALGSLMEIKTKKWKVSEAISILERLIRLEPDYIEWPLLKAHLHCNAGDLELAKVGFSEVLDKDPLRVEAYHGLVIAAAVADSSSEMADIEKRLDKGMELCKTEERKDVLTGLKLLLAQIRVLEGKYDEGLKIYQELVEEEPRDFRPYLCQGILYTLLRKKKEAEECLEKFRRLVPEGHPFGKYLHNSVLYGQNFRTE